MSLNLFFINTLNPIVKNSTIKIIAFLGQSNLGTATSRIGPTYYDPDYLNPISNSKIINGYDIAAGWADMSTAINTYIYAGTLPLDISFGAEVSLSYELQEYLNKDIYIYKCGKGTTSLGGQWQKGNAMYEQAIPNLLTAMQLVFDSGKNCILSHIVWIQGEADAGPTASVNYFANLNQFYADIKADLSTKYTANSKPFFDPHKLIIKLNNDTYGGVDPVSIGNVQQAQSDFCNNSTNNATLIDWQGLSYSNTHYTGYGLLDGGIILFDNIKNEY